MATFHGVSLSGVFCCLLLVLLLGGAISRLFAPVASITEGFLPGPQTLGNMLMPN